MKVSFPFPAFALAAGAFLAALISGCDLNDKVTGGSSEVDNPILVAFTRASGESLHVTGSLSVYLADQNPSVDPDPLLRKQLAGASSVRLTGADFTQGVHLDSARTYNLLLLTGDSGGALLREVRFDPRTGRYTSGETRLTALKLAPSPLVRYASTLTGIDTGLVRVFVPGTPFQTVLVDSEFVFEAVPAGELSFRAVVGNQEVHLARDSGGGGPRHRVDSTRPPRPTSPPPKVDSLRAFAGPDVVIYLGVTGTSITLNGGVSGVNPDDPRLAVLWKQVHDSNPQPQVQLTNRTLRQAKAHFSEAGAYRFVFSASYGPAKSQDTVRVAVQPPPNFALFSAPAPDFVVYLNEPFQVSWYDVETDTVQLQYRADSVQGSWQNVSGKMLTSPGMNEFEWTPSGEPAQRAQLRLVTVLGAPVATSSSFTVTRRPPAQKPVGTPP